MKKTYEYKMVGFSNVDGGYSVIHKGDDLSSFDEIHFSVYAILPNGESVCLADLHNRIDAEKIVEELNFLSQKQA